jgi:hypothetical protein
MYFYNSFYRSILMRKFVNALKEFQSIENREAEIYLGNFLAGEDNRNAIQIRNYRAFRETCDKLCKVGCYSMIIRFMYGAFLCGKTYDLAKLKDILDKVKIRSDVTLSELCADFFLYMQKNSIFFEQDSGIDFDSIDLYRGDAELYFKLNVYSPGDITKEISQFVLTHLFNLNVCIDHISRQDIDRVVAESIRIKTMEMEKEIERINGENRELEELEKQVNINLRKSVPKKMTEFEKKLEVAGLLLDLFMVAELTNQDDIVYYIQTEYLWPIMKIVPWKEKDNYRNIVAHKDGVSIQAVEDCRNILLQSEYLLWILLYILNGSAEQASIL